MQIFKSSKGVVILFILQSFLWFSSFCLLLHIFSGFQLSHISFLHWMWISILYLFICYCYAGFFNNDILVFDDRIEVVNTLPLFKKHMSFSFENIKSVTFRHDYRETFGNNIKSELLKQFAEFFFDLVFPPYYKWIRVQAGKEYKFYCFGIETDYYERVDSLVFEDLFRLLAEKGIAVKWTNHTEAYYLSMNDSVKNKVIEQQ